MGPTLESKKRLRNVTTNFIRQYCMRQRDEAGKMYFYTAKIHPKTQTSKILSGPLGEGFLMKDWTGHFQFFKNQLVKLYQVLSIYYISHKCKLFPRVMSSLQITPSVRHISSIYTRVRLSWPVYTHVGLATHHPTVETILRWDWMGGRRCHLAGRQTSVKWRKTSASVESVGKIPAKIR